MKLQHIGMHCFAALSSQEIPPETPTVWHSSTTTLHTRHGQGPTGCRLESKIDSKLGSTKPLLEIIENIKFLTIDFQQ